MAKIKDMLLKAGYTAEEITAMGTMIDNPRFASSIQAELDRVEKLEKDVLAKQATIDGDTKWYQEICVPQTNQHIQDVANAKAEAAAVKARLKALEDAGVVAKQTPEVTPAVTPVVPAVDPKTGEYVTKEQFGQAYERVGDAIEMAQDIVADHQELFGKRLPGGIAALRKKYREAVAARSFNGDLRQFWEKDNNVDARRQELVTEDQKKHDDSIRLEERNRIASLGGNPMTATMQPSRNPFTNRKVSENGQPLTDTQRPWEKSGEGRASDRVSKFSKAVLQQSVQ